MSALKDEILGLLKDSVKDLWDQDEDTDFLKEIAEEMATQTLAIHYASDPAKRAAAEQNLKIWQSVLDQKIAQKSLKLGVYGRMLFQKVIEVLGKATLLYLRGATGGLIGG